MFCYLDQINIYILLFTKDIILYHGQEEAKFQDFLYHLWSFKNQIMIRIMYNITMYLLIIIAYKLIFTIKIFSLIIKKLTQFLLSKILATFLYLNDFKDL